MEYRAKRSNYWFLSQVRYFGIFLVGVIWLGATWLYPGATWMVMKVEVCMLVFFFIGPGIYLLIEYLRYNKKSLLAVDDDKHELSYNEEGDELIRCSFNEIDKIHLYMYPQRYKGKPGPTTSSYYAYARFQLKDNRIFYITCLMIPDIKLKEFVEEHFSEVEVHYHKKLYCSIKLHHLFHRKELEGKIRVGSCLLYF